MQYLIKAFISCQTGIFWSIQKSCVSAYWLLRRIRSGQGSYILKQALLPNCVPLLLSNTHCRRPSRTVSHSQRSSLCFPISCSSFLDALHTKQTCFKELYSNPQTFRPDRVSLIPTSIEHIAIQQLFYVRLH